jgi:hypothetical protein
METFAASLESISTKYFGAPAGARYMPSEIEEEGSSTLLAKFLCAKETFGTTMENAPTFDYQEAYNKASFDKSGFEAELKQGKIARNILGRAYDSPCICVLN